MNDRWKCRSRLLVAVLAVSIAALSCAGPNKLAEQSEKAYGEGDLEKAYQKAARALRKEPENRRARAAMTQAAARLMDEREAEIRGMAARDTVAAAKRSLHLDGFREELIQYRIILPPDPDFDRDEATIRAGAARLVYGESVEALESGSPKRAYDGFRLAREFQPKYRDVEERIDEAYDEALPRVAFLPFANETDIPALGRNFYERAYAEVGRRILTQGFRFTALAERERVIPAVPLLALDHIGPRIAARIGRELGVDRVIIGRFHSMRSNTNTGTFTQTIFKRTVDKDEKGVRSERFVERTMEVLTRDREISIGYEYSIVDVRDQKPIVGNAGTLRAAAHAIYTSGPVGADDDEDDYCLLAPDVERQDPERARRVKAQWEERCGDWKLKELIVRSRKERARGYESRYQEDWVLRPNGRAFFLGDVPSESELARYAYGQVWEPLARTLKDVDQAEPSAFRRP